MRSVVSDSATPWTVARQAPLSMGILQARILEWGATSFSRGSSRPRDLIHVSRIARWFFFFFFLITSTTWEAPRWVAVNYCSLFFPLISLVARLDSA